MPYTTTEVAQGYQVKNKQTGKVHAKATSKAKAEAQMRLLRGVEHGMVPRTTSQVAGLDSKKVKAGSKSSSHGRAKAAKGGRK